VEHIVVRFEMGRGRHFEREKIAQVTLAGFAFNFRSKIDARVCLDGLSGHGEVLTPTQWSGVGGQLLGESPERIGWFRDYITNTTIHPAFEECDGSDDGFVQTLHCGDTFHLFRFYHGRTHR
jgi:hypothetical protein